MNEYKDYRESYQGEARANWYENKVYEKGGFDEMLWHAEKTILTTMLGQCWPSMKGLKILDFACGTGRITEFLESLPDTDKIDALDISEGMVDIARTKTRNVNFIVGDILENPDVINEEYDLITTFRFVLLAEADLRGKVFERLSKAVQTTGGKIAVGIHGNPISRRFFVHCREFVFRVPLENRTKSFSIGDMRLLATSAGLKIDAIEGVGFVPRTLFKILGPKISYSIEKMICRIPFAGRFGSNLIVLCSASNSAKSS